VTAVAHFPASFDKGWLDRLRRPLAALAATILVIDLMGLGMHLADSAESPFADDAPTRAKTSIGGPEAVVPNTAVRGSDATREAVASQPLGCLAINSGCYAGPPAPTAPSAPGGTSTTPPGKSPAPTTPTPAAQPLAQADVGVPALGAQVSLGVGAGGCTGLNLTVIAVGGCPAVTGDGPLLVKLGGTLLGD
jgi:hypothetical protein